jgi:hypothetical protein
MHTQVVFWAWYGLWKCSRKATAVAQASERRLQTIAHGTVLRFHWVGHSVRLKSKCATGNPLLSLYRNLVQESGFELAKLSIRITDMRREMRGLPRTLGRKSRRKKLTMLVTKARAVENCSLSELCANFTNPTKFSYNCNFNLFVVKIKNVR